MKRNHDKIAAVAEVVREYNLYEAPIWSDLDELSTHTSVDDIEVDETGIVLEGKRFRGVANVYVTLQFGRNDDEGFHESDSFLANFEGRFADTEPVIETFTIDTSSRYDPN